MFKCKKYFVITALIWSGCAVLLVFLYMLLLAPQTKESKKIKVQLEQAKQVYRSALNAAQKGTQIRMKKQIEQLERRLGDFVIDAEDSANVVFQISRIASEMDLGSFNIKTKQQREGSEIPNCKLIQAEHIAVSFTGGFNQFAAFLNSLERHRPVIFVDEFKITRSKTGGHVHQADMNLTVFVKKPQKS